MIVLSEKAIEILLAGGWLWLGGKTIRLSAEGFVEEWTEGVWGPVGLPPSAPIGTSGVDLSVDT
jgi:hypothetical protein